PLKCLATGPIQPQEVKLARLWWIRRIQRKHFADVIKFLADTRTKGKEPPLIKQLGLRLDGDGFLRSYGRLCRSTLSDATKFPLLLPRKAPFTNLIILNAHFENFHSGVRHTLSSLRLNYWIPQGRAEVQRLIRQCTICRRFEGGPYKLPHMAPLPSSRVTQSQRPYQTTGIDYFGPLRIKGNVPGETMKVW
ncbi:MAG: hypothetical protein GY696_24730, partial [Gammaproteobacteria bacterium]|nr:hypothetical protein [Gammaproteobacteria bacterium]